MLDDVARAERDLGADPVDALAHPGRVFGTANMSTRADGLAALMNMGLVTSTGTALPASNASTALRASVVFTVAMFSKRESSNCPL